jgi:DNA-binding FrmR family transcriptional regulator
MVLQAEWIVSRLGQPLRAPLWLGAPRDCVNCPTLLHDPFARPAGASRAGCRNTTEFSMTTIQDEARKRALLMRLKRIEGQLRGIQRLIETGEDCEKVAQQLAAARKALDKSFFTMVGCVIAQGELPPDDVADLLAKYA